MADKNRVCPVEAAHHLDNRIRRWFQNPKKILFPYVKEGMTVLDLGCGPGFFSVDMAVMVGDTGKVIASDLQEGMLQKLKAKIQGTELEDRIILHRCEKDKIGWTEPVYFALAFYMVHEVPDQENFFKELNSIVKQGGLILIAEPPFHVSKAAFEETIKIAVDAGFLEVERPKVLLSKAVVLKKAEHER